jgi:hypothetical protein
MGVDGVRSAGATGTQQAAATSFQAKDALENGQFKLPPQLRDTMAQAKDIYGKDFGPKYMDPAIAEAEANITKWINEHPTADASALEQTIEREMNNAITKQQGKKIGDDFFMRQIIAKMTAALKFNTDTFEG